MLFKIKFKLKFIETYSNRKNNKLVLKYQFSMWSWDTTKWIGRHEYNNKIIAFIYVFSESISFENFISPNRLFFKDQLVVIHLNGRLLTSTSSWNQIEKNKLNVEIDRPIRNSKFWTLPSVTRNSCGYLEDFLREEIIEHSFKMPPSL